MKNKMKLSTTSLNWLPKAENWTTEELQNRGSLLPVLRDSKVVLIGAGSLGSVLAEQMIRMGLQDLTIIDSDSFEAGNLVRHTLVLSDISKSKAEALAEHLQQCNPLATVKGLNISVPAYGDTEFESAIKEAMLFIDATASDDLLKLMPLTGMLPDAVLVSSSIGLYSEQLFLYAVYAKEFSWEDFNDWFKPFKQEQNELAQKIDLPRGIGCWHPLTPAKLNRICGLAGMAVEVIENLFDKPAVLPVRKCIEWPDLSC